MKQEDIPLQPEPRGYDKRFLRAPFIVAILVLIALLGWWLWPKHPVSAPAAAVPVNAGHATLLDFPIRLAAVGTVQALNTVDVKVRVDGQLARVAFTEGQDVKAG